MANIIIKTGAMELTDAIREYAEKRIGMLEKFMQSASSKQEIHIELVQTTKHHKQGMIYLAEVTIMRDGKKIHAVSEQEDLYAAIDDVKEEVERQLVGKKGRDNALFRRGARSVKKMMKGISKRNPFTSKY